MKQKFDGIDLMKFVASVFVVAIHTNPLATINPLLNTLLFQGIARMAVPLFFTASAFFIFYSPGINEVRVKKQVFRLLQLYICWFILELPMTLYSRFYRSSFSPVITVFRFVRSFFVTSTFSGSWFLTSCIFCAIVYMLIEKISSKQLKEILIVVISILAYTLCIISSEFGGVLRKWDGFAKVYDGWEMIFGNPYTSILAGIPYFALARMLVNEKIKIGNGVGLAFLAALVVEVILVDSYKCSSTNDCYIMLLPCAAFIFIKAKDMKIEIKCAAKLRSISTLVFFSHFIWMFALEVCEFAFSLVLPNLVKFVLTITGSMILAFGVEKLSRSDNFMFLKRLY